MKSWLGKYIAKNPLQAIVQIVTIVLFAGNIWFSVKLFPIVTDIITIKLQVSAMQIQLDKNTSLVSQFSTNTVEITQIKEDIRGIKDTAIRLEGKFDRVLESFTR